MLSEHAYAQYDLAAQNAVVKLPPALDGQPFPAEPLACAINIFRRSGIQPGQTVAIVGIGFLGALLTRLASDAGARVIAINRRPAALEMAGRMGAAHALAMDGQTLEQVQQLTGEELCPVVIEAAGTQATLDLAAALTGIRGRLVIAGYHQDGLRQCNLQLWNWRGLDVINAHERDPEVYRRGMELAVGMRMEGQLDATPLYTHRFPLQGLGEALDLAMQRPEGFVKALVEIAPGRGGREGSRDNQPAIEG
jgi:threonine dehydrogenase-like Zn-dependent dehydrogenase